MENSGSFKQSRLLGRLLGRLRGEHRYSALDKNVSFSSTGTCEDIGCGSANDDEDVEAPPRPDTSDGHLDSAQFAANIDMRYSGQYLTPEQLPEFCNQLSHLVDVIRNIQSYAKVTNEYPREMERRLEYEASEVSALVSEARHAHEAVARIRFQRKALRAQRSQLTAHLIKMKDTEIRELESSVRLSDRKLFKSWENVKDSADPGALETLLEDVTVMVLTICMRENKQTVLECLVRLIEGRLSQLTRPPPQPLPPPAHVKEDLVANRRRQENRRSTGKRKRTARDFRSAPVSNDPSRHEAKQVTLYIAGGSTVDALSRPRAASTLPSLELPRGSIRNIMFFTAN